MTDSTYVSHSHDIHLDKDYDKWLSQLISNYRKAQVKAAIKVNSEKLLWNWQLGRDLVLRKAEERWGAGIVEQVSLDLRAAFPNEKGFGSRNLWDMKRWYTFYTSRSSQERLRQLSAEIHWAENVTVTKLHQVGAEIQEDIDIYPFPPIFAYVPWKHHVEIISKCKNIEEAAFYIKLTIQENLSRNSLANCIKANLYATQSNAISNFQERLPSPQSDLAQELTKDNYDFGFIKLPYGYDEKMLENALCNQMTNFLLELGSGFAFMGRQKEIVVAGRSRLIDLLFYHIRLRAYVIVEIKTKPFEPEFAGKLNFYVNAVNDLLKTSDDNPSIGLLICSDLKTTEVQYAFQGVTTPMGVASYTNVQMEEIKSMLPTIEQLQERIGMLEASLKERENHKSEDSTSEKDGI